MVDCDWLMEVSCRDSELQVRLSNAYCEAKGRKRGNDERDAYSRAERGTDTERGAGAKQRCGVRHRGSRIAGGGIEQHGTQSNQLC